MYYKFTIERTSSSIKSQNYTVTVTQESNLISNLPSGKLIFKQGSNTLLLSEYTQEKLSAYYNYTTGPRGNLNTTFSSYQQVQLYIRQVLNQYISSKDIVSLVSSLNNWEQI